MGTLFVKADIVSTAHLYWLYELVP